MSNPNDHPENLSVRSRRGALLVGEGAALDRLLEASPTLRMAHQLGRDFDQTAAVEAGDEQRVAHFVERALAARRPRRHGWFGPLRPSPWMAAAAVFAVCGFAFGFRGLWWPQPSTTIDTANAPNSSLHKSAASKLTAPRAVTEPTGENRAVAAQSSQNIAVPSLPIPSGSLVAPLIPTSKSWAFVPRVEERLPEMARIPNHNSRRKDSTATFSLDEPTEPDAAALLRQANRARSAGEVGRAVVLLRDLQARFRNSPEAHVSLVSLGKLLMLGGSQEAALQQFTSYLERSGPLEEEALLGRAQALQGLGRASEERYTWQRLLARFPGSIYAATARERLDALSRNAVE